MVFFRNDLSISSNIHLHIKDSLKVSFQFRGNSCGLYVGRRTSIKTEFLLMHPYGKRAFICLQLKIFNSSWFLFLFKSFNSQPLSFHLSPQVFDKHHLLFAKNKNQIPRHVSLHTTNPLLFPKKSTLLSLKKKKKNTN